MRMTSWCFGKFRSDGCLRQDSPADGFRDAERPDWQVLVFLNQLVDTEYDGPLRRAGGVSSGPQIRASQRPPSTPNIDAFVEGVFPGDHVGLTAGPD